MASAWECFIKNTYLLFHIKRINTVIKHNLRSWTGITWKKYRFLSPQSTQPLTAQATAENCLCSRPSAPVLHTAKRPRRGSWQKQGCSPLHSGYSPADTPILPKSREASHSPALPLGTMATSAREMLEQHSVQLSQVGHLFCKEGETQHSSFR